MLIMAAGIFQVPEDGFVSAWYEAIITKGKQRKEEALQNKKRVITEKRESVKP